jgi:hypothetical protein
MTKIKFTKNDIYESELLAKTIKKIDEIDADYVNSASDEIFKHQPFFLTVMLGHRHDVSNYELEEIMKLYFLVWEYFRSNPKIKTKLVTESSFNKIQKRNIEMLKYSDGETNGNDKLDIYTQDIQTIKSKALLAAIFLRFNDRPTLFKMDIIIKGVIMIGIKSFIECFESL